MLILKEAPMVYEWDAEQLAKQRARRVGSSLTLLLALFAGWFFLF